jgi:predicted Ser/Thr protein kinase
VTDDPRRAIGLYSQLLKVCNDNRGVFTFAELLEASIDLLVTVVREAEKEAPDKVAFTRKVTIETVTRAVNDDEIKLRVLH